MTKTGNENILCILLLGLYVISMEGATDTVKCVCVWTKLGHDL